MRAADGDDEAAKELKATLKAHADLHIDALLFERCVVRLGTRWLIVDPMHGLELNVAKTGWKYTIGYRMLEPHREKVADYLASIGCYLDIRAKGTRNPEQKWFSAATFDEFTLGTARCADSAQRAQNRPCRCIPDHEQLFLRGFLHQAARAYHADRISTQEQLLASS